MMRFMQKSKKGITLVESVFAVVILGILTIGILSLLTAGGVKIHQISNESSAYAEAAQKLDLLIAAVSNGYGDVDETTKMLILPTYANEDEEPAIAKELKKATITIDEVSIHKDGTLRGWYLTLKYNGASISGFVSNTEGVFDQHEEE